jgi:hypothetical protein
MSITIELCSVLMGSDQRMKSEIHNVLDVVITTSPALPDVVCRMSNETRPSVGTAPL